MLVLDDLHWADRPSLLLLEFICQEIQEIPLLNRRHLPGRNPGELDPPTEL